MNLLCSEAVFAEEGDVAVADPSQVSPLASAGYRVVAWYTEKDELSIRTGEVREGKYGDVDVVRYEVVDCMRFLMKRSAESTVRAATERAETAERKVYTAEQKAREAEAAKAKAETETASLRGQLATATHDSRIRRKLESDIAKLREALGSREFTRIVGEE